MEYIIEKNELKKISFKFRNIASRLLNTDFRDGVENVKRLLSYIKETPIIYDFILKNNVKQFDIKKIVKEKGTMERFQIPCDIQEEISFVYQLLVYISENITDYGLFAIGYAPGRKLQDMVDAFNNDVVKPFINYIIEYLEEVKIDMGMDDTSKIDINISDVNNSQVSIARGNSSVNAYYNSDNDNIKQIKELTETIFKLSRSEGLSDEILEEMKEILDTIKKEVSAKKPKKSILKYCNDKLSELANIVSTSVKIGTSIVALIKLLQPYI